MIEVISDKVVTARKKYYCELCISKINKGQKYRTQFNKYFGDVGTFRAHTECCELSKIIVDADEDGIDEDNFKEAMTDYVRKYHYDEAIDDIEVEWQRKSDYDLVKKILAELKANDTTHIKLE